MQIVKYIVIVHIYKSLGYYSFRILITLDFIKSYENIMNLYAII